MRKSCHYLHGGFIISNSIMSSLLTSSYVVGRSITNTQSPESEHAPQSNKEFDLRMRPFLTQYSTIPSTRAGVTSNSFARDEIDRAPWDCSKRAINLLNIVSVILDPSTQIFPGFKSTHQYLGSIPGQTGVDKRIPAYPNIRFRFSKY